MSLFKSSNRTVLVEVYFAVMEIMQVSSNDLRAELWPVAQEETLTPPPPVSLLKQDLWYWMCFSKHWLNLLSIIDNFLLNLVFVPTGTFRQLMIFIYFGYFSFFYNRRKDYKTCSKNPRARTF